MKTTGETHNLKIFRNGMVADEMYSSTLGTHSPANPTTARGLDRQADAHVVADQEPACIERGVPFRKGRQAYSFGYREFRENYFISSKRPVALR